MQFEYKACVSFKSIQKIRQFELRLTALDMFKVADWKAALCCNHLRNSLSFQDATLKSL